MSGIILKNRTGHKSGFYLRYEFGEDLFGYLYLDVFRGKKHVAKRIKRETFDNPRDFIIALDLDLERKESLNYVPE